MLAVTSPAGSHDDERRAVRRIAHDLNNVMTALQGYAEILLEDVGPSSPLRSDLEQLQQAARRAAELVGELTTASR